MADDAGLSDMLSQLADGQVPPSVRGADGQGRPPGGSAGDDALPEAALLDSPHEEGGESVSGSTVIHGHIDMTEPEPAGGQTDGAPTALDRMAKLRADAKAAKHQRSLKAKKLSIPILLSVAGLLLVPGFWAILVLAGAGVWMSKRPGAQGMAYLMLVCLPVAAALFGGAWVFYKQVCQGTPEMAPDQAVPGFVPTPQQPAPEMPAAKAESAPAPLAQENPPAATSDQPPSK